MKPDLHDADILGQVRDAARAFLLALGARVDIAQVTPLQIEISFEGAWPIYVDASAMLRELAAPAELTCHSIWRPTPDATTAPAIVLASVHERPGVRIRHRMTIAVSEASLAHAKAISSH